MSANQRIQTTKHQLYKSPITVTVRENSHEPIRIACEYWCYRRCKSGIVFNIIPPTELWILRERIPNPRELFSVTVAYRRPVVSSRRELLNCRLGSNPWSSKSLLQVIMQGLQKDNQSWQLLRSKVSATSQ